MNTQLSPLRFLFTITLGRADLAHQLARIHYPRKLPRVLHRRMWPACSMRRRRAKYKAALSVAYGAGLRASEVVALKVSDIDSTRMLLRVEQGKGRKDRFAMLSPTARHPARMVAHWRLRLVVPRPGSPATDHAPAEPCLPHGR